jgi:hypothetical protein
MAIYSVYYMRSEFFCDGIKGYDWLQQHKRMPDVADLTASHVHLVTIDAGALEEVYFKMQGEDWSANVEARELVHRKGVRHTSMAVGDIAIDHDSNFAYLLDRAGFRFLGKVTTVGLLGSLRDPSG